MRALRSQPRHPARQFWLAWLCALALLASQGLGHWHRIAHGARLGNVAALSGVVLKSVDGWGHQSGDADCHLFDQLSHDQLLSDSGAPACLAGVAIEAGAALPADAAAAARWKRGARGPPVLA
ncbi:hypothetical protein [Roseateles violae]|uniref:Uncharacterized protein n=1 Tax=Roseateles violae TaxID=3058042 RepID=A0ABT8DRC0_9BURK|nr:hypothetical protein [Pelomonas sp. PFR6]MDN3920571.1 hypothetical protein [Pelomonas sp. PFR6]